MSGIFPLAKIFSALLDFVAKSLKQEKTSCNFKTAITRANRSNFAANTSATSTIYTGETAHEQCHSEGAHEEAVEDVVDLAAVVEVSEAAVEADEEDSNRTTDHQMQSSVSYLADNRLEMFLITMAI
jgi:hypothetical protein